MGAAYGACQGKHLFSHLRFLDNHRMNTSEDVLEFKTRHNHL